VCDALKRFLDFTGRWDEWLSLTQQAEARALSAGDLNNAGWRAYDSGAVYYRRQESDAVLACADRAAAHWKAAEAGDRERAAAIRLRGIGHQMKEDYNSAIVAYREALDLGRNLSESADVAISLNWLANAEKDAGDLKAAERDYRESLGISRAVGQTPLIATATKNLAGLALLREDWPKAETLAREALPLSEQVGRQELIAEDCYRLANALVRQGKLAEALPYARRATDIYRQLGMPSDLEAARKTLEESEA
jgi:tetratricopeptide (TPR) repeat protein